MAILSRRQKIRTGRNGMRKFERWLYKNLQFFGEVYCHYYNLSFRGVDELRLFRTNEGQSSVLINSFRVRSSLYFHLVCWTHLGIFGLIIDLQGRPVVFIGQVWMAGRGSGPIVLWHLDALKIGGVRPHCISSHAIHNALIKMVQPGFKELA